MLFFENPFDSNIGTNTQKPLTSSDISGVLLSGCTLYSYTFPSAPFIKVSSPLFLLYVETVFFHVKMPKSSRFSSLTPSADLIFSVTLCIFFYYNRVIPNSFVYTLILNLANTLIS